MSVEDIKRMKDFLKNGVQQYTPLSKIALINFGSEVNIPLKLTFQQNDLFASIENLQKIGGSRRTDLALQKIKDEIFTIRFQNVLLRQIVLITSGDSDLLKRDALARIAKGLKEENNAKIAIVAIGNSINKDLLDDVSSNEESTIQIYSSDKLPSVVDDVFSVISKNAGTTFFSRAARWYW